VWSYGPSDAANVRTWLTRRRPIASSPWGEEVKKAKPGPTRFRQSQTTTVHVMCRVDAVYRPAPQKAWARRGRGHTTGLNRPGARPRGCSPSPPPSPSTAASASSRVARYFYPRRLRLLAVPALTSRGKP
jgi:hypothetical protein